MATLSVNSVSKAGIVDIDVPLVSADVAGDDVVSSSKLLLVLKNDDASPHTLTLTRPSATIQCGNVGLADLSDIVLIVAGSDIGFVTIPDGYASAGSFSWTYDAVTSLSIGIFSLAP